MSDISREDISSSHTNQSDKSPHFIQPEFTLIDDRNGESRHTRFRGESIQNSGNGTQHEDNTPSQGFLPYRWVFLGGVIFCILFGFGMLFLSLATTIVSLCFLFQNREINQLMWNNWKTFLFTLLTGFCFTLGILFPRLAIWLLAIYLSFSNDSDDESILNSYIKRSFENV